MVMSSMGLLLKGKREYMEDAVAGPRPTVNGKIVYFRNKKKKAKLDSTV